MSREVVIEATIKGDEHRLLVVGGKFFAASCRRPAQVKGDGVSTVRELVEKENRRPERQGGRNVALTPVKLDKTAVDCLADQVLSPDAIPAAGQPAVLRRGSGDIAHDITDRVHASIRDVAERTASTLGIDVCGVDFITTDISKPYWETGGAICEVNTRPGLDLHTGVVEGTPRDAAGAILEMLYPADTPSRIPVIVVLREFGDTELEADIHNAAIAGGQNIGLVSSGATSLGPQKIVVQSSSLLESVVAVLTDGTLEGAIVGVTPDELVRHGIGLDRIDLAILPSGAEGPIVDQVSEVLRRLANGQVVESNDPAATDRALSILGVRATQNHPKARRSAASPPSADITSIPAPPVSPDTGTASDFVTLMVGDIAFGESYSQKSNMTSLRRNLAIHGHGYSLARLKNLLGHADMIIGNLEVPLAMTPNKALEGAKEYLHWCDPDETLASLVEAGFNAVSVANNHTLDCGEAGLRETIRLAEASGIAAFGAGDDVVTAARPFVRTVRIGPVEKTIVVFAGFEFRQNYNEQFGWYAGTNKFGVNSIDPAAIAAEITRLRDTVPNPLFIAYPHWGVDYRETRQYQRDLAAQLIAAGVDLVIGHGAHSLQGVETIMGHTVLYGLGNFAFNSPGRFEKMKAPPYGLAATLRFRHGPDGVSIVLRLYPLLIDNRKSNYQNRVVSPLEFPEAFAALTKHYDAAPGDLRSGVDEIGHYVEVPVRTANGKDLPSPQETLPLAAMS